jgi:predicted aspartyl protease
LQKYIHYVVNCKQLFIIRLTITILTVLIAIAGKAQKSSARLLTEIPFRTFTGGVIAVQARLDSAGELLTFILDTGCGGISLDSSTCERLKLPLVQSDTTVSGIAGQKKVPFLFNRKLHLPGLTVDKLNFYVNDYSTLAAVYGERIDGIIGYSFLSRFIVNINFDTARIKIFTPGKMRYNNAGIILHPYINYLPVQPLTVKDKNKVMFNFYMDTGAGLCFLMSEKFASDSNIVLSKRRPVITQAEGLGGKTKMQLTVVKSVQLGPYRFKNVPTYLYDDKMNITAYPFTGGLLGNDIMRRFNITLNYPAREIHIIPNTHFNDEFDYAYTGLTLYSTDSIIHIEDLVTGSPADKAGLMIGDEILGIGTNFSGNIVQYSNLLQKTKEKINILLKRNEKLKIVSIEPISILR